ncbi:MAG: hypothetical protein RLZ33_1434 [Bacteroidota bacterium]|jgi:hypothetical protein
MNFSYPNSWRKVFGLSATFLITLLVVVACKKKESTLGNDVLDPNSLLNSTQVDTFQLTTFTIAEDSLISDNPAYAVLGSYNDPKFGKVEASFYTQVVLSGLNPNFGDISAITVDSLVLGLEYADYYGELSPQTVEVYQLTEKIDVDSTYYSFQDKAHSSTNLVVPGYETFTPTPNGETIIGEDTVDAQLRIRLNNSLATQLINESASGGTNYSSIDNFTSYFKGLYVKVNNGSQLSGKGAVFYFNLNDPLSKMTIYYTQAGEQKTFDFLINSECADFNHVDIDNSGKPVQNVINDTISGQTEFYAQAFKSRAIVKIPGLKNLPKKCVIHKAELILPVQYQTASKYSPSDEISVSVRIDNILSGIGVFGFYDNYTKSYTVDCRDYVQALVTGQISTTELILSPRFFITSAERIIFNGPSTINKKKPQIVVTYTQY